MHYNFIKIIAASQAYIISSKKEIVPCNMPERHRGRVEVQLYSFFNLGARWG